MKRSKDYFSSFFLLFILIVMQIEAGMALQLDQLAEQNTLSTSDLHETQRWAMELMAKQDYNQAQAGLSSLLKRHSSSVFLWRLLAEVEAQAGRISEAEEAYIMAVKKAEFFERGITQYLMANFFVRSGQREKAENVLMELKSVEIFKDLAEEGLQAAKEGSPLPRLTTERVRSLSQMALNSQERKEWTIVSSLTTGYDSNTSLLPDASGGNSGGSGYIIPAGQVYYDTQLVNSPLQLNFNASFTHNFDKRERVNNNLPLSLNGTWQLPGSIAKTHQLSLSNSLAYTFSNTNHHFDFFSVSDTLTLHKKLPYQPDKAFIFSLPLGVTDYSRKQGTGADDRGGLKTGLGVSHSHSYNGFNFTESFSYEHQFAAGDNYKYDQFTLSGELKAPPWKKIEGSFNAGFTHEKYPKSTSKRKDSKLSLALDLKREVEFLSSTTIGLGMGYMKNNSNIPSNEYDKNVISVKVNHVY